MQPYKKKTQEDISQNGKDDKTFKMPTPVASKQSAPPPGFKGQQSKDKGAKSTPPPGFKGQSQKSAPPPGFKAKEEVGQGDSAEPPVGSKRSGSEAELEEPTAKKNKTADASNERLLPRDSSKDFCTVFVSNLSFDVDEEEIKTSFLSVVK